MLMIRSFRTSFTGLLVATLAACSPPGPVGHHQISMAQAMAASRVVAPGEGMKVPLVLIFDQSGKLIDKSIGWEGESSMAAIGEKLSREGTSEVWKPVLEALGQGTLTSDRPVAMAVSIGDRCQPCVAMEADFPALSGRYPHARFEVFSTQVSKY